ncbi:hypothetical protein [Glaciimonas soli]|uniref:Uncharacterized protein n=1 Tax=Glaciimonas soli TaxID=2590999 RepID=A0A843YX97_9BURK|nr:hypothetical protein [Glaciimonas soli]MQR02098.1 hypothetical protein [Glaciimonas soli]
MSFASAITQKTSITKVSLGKTQEIKIKVHEKIKSDMQDDSVLIILNDQSFNIGKFDVIPFSYFSKAMKNQICMLAVFDSNNVNNDKLIKLYAEKNDEDEVVERCVNVNSVKKIGNSLLFLIRLNIGQQEYSAARKFLIEKKGLENDAKENEILSNEKFNSINDVSEFLKN